MTKFAITRLWVAGLVAVVVGLVVLAVSVVVMLAYGGTFTPSVTGNGSDFTPAFNGVFWTTVVFETIGLIAVIVGAMVDLAAWIGALVTTYRLEDKAWFIALLIGGLLGLGAGLIGFAAMLAYVIAGPDTQPLPAPQPPVTVAPPEYAHVG